ncbi:MAG: hypothetical protein EA370_03660 [Wenzhouxiangella sp.]|nr:MAG: hypothetical protein EA370_03660 [Wenzhouxiangella sp.]
MNDRRLLQYTAAVGAVAAAGPILAEPQPIPQTRIDAEESSTQPDLFFFSAGIDLTGDGDNGLGVFGFFDFDKDDGYITFSGSSGTYIARAFVKDGYVAQAFAPGDQIDEDLDFSESFVDFFSRNWFNPPDGDYEVFLEERGFVGLQFQLSGVGSVYACMEVQVKLESPNVFGLIVRGGLYEDQANTPVTCPDFLPDEVFQDRFSDD